MERASESGRSRPAPSHRIADTFYIDSGGAFMKAMTLTLLGVVLLAATTAVQAQNEQFIPVLSYRVGPYAAGGSGYYGGAIDYWTLVNLSGGVNGVKLKWEECETEYNASKGVECYERLKKKNGGATTVEPRSTGNAYGLVDS